MFNGIGATEPEELPEEGQEDEERLHSKSLEGAALYDSSFKAAARKISNQGSRVGSFGDVQGKVVLKIQLLDNEVE